MLINKYGSSEQGRFGPMGNHEGSQKGELSGSLPRGEPGNGLHCETGWKRAENTEEITISSGLKNISRAGLISSTTFIKFARPNAEAERSRREFLEAGDPESALRILLTLMEESSDGFDYIDDSDGELGGYLDSPGVTLAEVILSLDLDEEQREDLVSDLDELHDRLSDYGVEGLGVAILSAQHGWGEPPRQAPACRAEADEEEDELEDDEWDESDEEWGDEADGALAAAVMSA